MSEIERLIDEMPATDSPDYEAYRARLTEALSAYKNKSFNLRSDWCDEDNQQFCEFFSYPEDGACPCGMHKHHVHCQHGGIIQIG